MESTCNLQGTLQESFFSWMLTFCCSFFAVIKTHPFQLSWINKTFIRTVMKLIIERVMTNLAVRSLPDIIRCPSDFHKFLSLFHGSHFHRLKVYGHIYNIDLFPYFITTELKSLKLILKNKKIRAIKLNPLVLNLVQKLPHPIELFN